MSGVFISYRREDSSYIAGRLHDRLAAALGPERIFRDVDAMKPGVDFNERIGEAVGSCDVLLAIIGNDWLSVRDPGGGRRIDQPKDWVRLEIAAALTRRILVVPVLVESARMPTEDDLPADLAPLATRNAMDLTDRRWQSDTESLLETIKEVLTPEPAAPAPASTGVPAAPTRQRPDPGSPRPDGPPPAARRAGRTGLAALPAWARVVLGLAALALVLVALGSLFGDDTDGGSTSRNAFASPNGLALDGAGNLFVTDPGNSTLLRIDLAGGAVSSVEGDPPLGDEGAPVSFTPWAVTVASGTLYVADKVDGEGGVLRRRPDGVITTVPARAAGRDLPGAAAIAVDGEGRLVVATDRDVLRVGPDGSLTLVAGSATKGFGGDGGPATAAKLSSPSALAFAPDGSLYIADSGNRRVRRVGSDGVISTVAGTGSETPSGDGGLAVEAGLGKRVLGLAVDGGGDVYVAAENQVRRISPGGRISRFAGHPEYESGFTGDGGPATAARLQDVLGLAVDAGGNLYLVDAGNHRVRRVDPAGVITTVA